MAMLYANRGYISINNQRLADIKSITLKVNRNARAVPTMTADGFNTGFTIGNYEIDLTFSLAVENLLSTPKLELLDFSTIDVQATVFYGADIFTLTGLFMKDAEESAPNVGEEVTKTFNMGALKIVDQVGNSSLFNLLS